jgi:molecular chaperone GrpE
MAIQDPNPGADAPEMHDTAPDNAALEASGESLASELDQLRAALALIREETLRDRAELDNQRKRMAREIEGARRFANERLLSELLPVFDSLHAGLAATGSEANPLRDGMELTLRQLLKVANDNGLAEIDPLGQPFDPEWHQAISQAPAGEAAPGSVLQVFQRGYRLNERLLRPALVVVAAD